MSEKRQRLLSIVDADIQQDVSAYQSILGLMQGLYESLMARDCLRIEEANAQVAQLLEEVRTRSGRRAKILQAFNVTVDSEGMRLLLAGYPSFVRPKLLSNWEKLAHMVEACKQLNGRNGQLIAMHNDIILQLLNSRTESGLYAQYRPF